MTRSVSRSRRDICLRCFACSALLLLACTAYADVQEPPQPSLSRQPAEPTAARAARTSRRAGAGAAKRGLVLTTDQTSTGYTLFAPLGSTTTYLVDLHGEMVHSWPSKYAPGMAVYLLDDGSVLRCAQEPGNRHFGGGGIGGRIERIAPDGTLLWTYVCADENCCQHHDIKPLPNGHVLLIAWEKKTRRQAIAAGLDFERTTGDEIWPDCVLEVEPQGESGGKTLWEWHAWDHLVQDVDEGQSNFGVIAEHPELIDLNYRRAAPRETPAEMQRLRSLGYVGGRESEEVDEENAGPPPFGPGPGGFPGRADWSHTNSIDYNAELDQIALSVHTFNEIWIIDHSTTTKEAAGHRGGRSGKGGDLLYRWGNPRAYGAGDAKDQMLFAQHDVRWIPEGSPGSGHLMMFNNGPGRPDGTYSSVVEISPSVDSAGHYQQERGKAFGPSKPSWEYTAAKREDFFSSHISGAERLPNGNTLICSGEQGRIFEVTGGGKTVWEYLNPYLEHTGPGWGIGPLLGWLGGGRPRDKRSSDGGREQTTAGGGTGSHSRTTVQPTTQPQSDDVVVQEGKVSGTSVTEGGARIERHGRPRPPGRPPLGRPFGPPGGGPGGPVGGPEGGLFRAARISPEHPGVVRILQAKLANSNHEP